jgi:hypothetical protein
MLNSILAAVPCSCPATNAIGFAVRSGGLSARSVLLANSQRNSGEPGVVRSDVLREL